MILPLETLRWKQTGRAFLVCIRTAAALPSWIDSSKPRTWDLLLNYYQPPNEIPDDADMVIVGGITKFPATWEINRVHDGFLARYDAVFFLDDDIDINFDDVASLFSLFRRFDLMLAQPSLTPQSYSSWPITLRRPEYRLRFTNFVEIMAPIFSRSALERCLETFLLSKSGWGLDFAWPVLLGSPRDKVAIIDEITMTHPKAVDPKEGRFYQYLRALEVDPYQEFAKLCEAYGLGPSPIPHHYGAVISRSNGTDTIVYPKESARRS